MQRDYRGFRVKTQVILTLMIPKAVDNRNWISSFRVPRPIAVKIQTIHVHILQRSTAPNRAYKGA